MDPRICPNCGHELDGRVSEIGVCYNCGECVTPQERSTGEDDYDGVLENLEWGFPEGLDQYWPQSMTRYLDNGTGAISEKNFLLCPEATEPKPRGAGHPSTVLF